MRTASLGSEQGSRRMLLELPPPTAAATGVLPVPGTGMRPLPQAAPAMGQATPMPPSVPPAMAQPQQALPDGTTAMVPAPQPSLAGPVPGVPQPTPPPTDNFRNR
jgi:hypothetical protein